MVHRRSFFKMSIDRSEDNIYFCNPSKAVSAMHEQPSTTVHKFKPIIHHHTASHCTRGVSNQAWEESSHGQ